MRYRPTAAGRSGIATWSRWSPRRSAPSSGIRRSEERPSASSAPAEITRFRLEHAEPWSVSKAALADQLDLFEQELNPLEWVPLDLRYSFRCAEDDCPTHDMGLKDWEAGQSYRKFLRKYGEHGVRDALRERWYTRMCAPSRAVHFFVGNIAAHPKTFMLLAVFYPERKVVEYVQDRLFGE